ncbi:SDR family NAD(P)-dependent oxidoreductase [Phytohabitans houttuyneae]|uniref:Oxidoreductase n=1 Tax=Phytohabitans houttuyneae TaxID=1076126 RepID=A0A6V8K580_9ACTN|nr:SDR family NAD(P)-dependent oxidoreductase [Phytohabitans houttuyneae]GFJ78660.1 oxidoreductase [Phytohabitans houttuyneae]
MTRILITGASDGLGRALAFALAERGYELILHGRDAGRLAEVADRTGSRAIQADLSSLAEVRRLAGEVEGDLDVLVNNAGVGFGAPGAPRELSADGYELRLAVNYLAPYLLTQLLLPRLKRAAPSRIVNVASIGQRPFDVDDPMMERGYDGTEAYRRAKLALIAYTFDLADELAGTGVTVNCLHPATLMPTTMVVQAGTGHVDTLERGLQATLRLVVDPRLAGVTGRFFDREREARALDQAYDPDFRKRLRELTESLVSARA